MPQGGFYIFLPLLAPRSGGFLDDTHNLYTPTSNLHAYIVLASVLSSGFLCTWESPQDLPKGTLRFVPTPVRSRWAAALASELALKSFPPGSGAGPSGLMAARIPMGPGADEQHLLESIARFCSALASGKISPDFRGLFCAARLIALPKKPRGVRPTAIGETLRSLAAKVLMAKYQSETSSELAPLQVGVGQPGAVESTVFKVREWARSAPAGHALLSLDFSNAFNTVDRSVMLKAIASRCPRFLPCALFAMGVPRPCWQVSQ